MTKFIVTYDIKVLTYHRIWGGKKVSPDVFMVHCPDVFIGCLSKNVVKFGLMTKKYLTCMNLNRLSLPYNDHDCMINWNGSSRAMEAGLAFDLVAKIHNIFKGLV